MKLPASTVTVSSAHRLPLKRTRELESGGAPERDRASGPRGDGMDKLTIGDAILSRIEESAR
jgi:hypothetical protein